MLEHALHRFGPFIIVRTLGRGGMGEVFIARTPWDENPIAAVKRLRPDVARVPTFAERFKHEAELAVRLDHPNVVGTLDVGSVEGQIYVCSKLVLGKDTGLIADRLRERGQGGPAAVAIRLLIDTLAALAYVHGVCEPDGRPLQLVHRDVTPGNVLVGYDGIARLADFGLAKSLLTERHQLTNHGEILGTPHYLAPEVIRGDRASPSSDLYGLGAVTYRFLTGVAPHQGTTPEVLMKVLSEKPRPLSELRPDLPSWFVEFVHRMLEADPARRPSDAAALIVQLQHEARTAGFLVSRSSVSRWLGALFQPEKADELEERDRIAAIDPQSVPSKPEGTVVLARPRLESRLAAPARITATDEYSDSEGTELELAEHRVRAYASSDEIPIDFGSTTAPSDVTDTSARPLGREGINFDEDSVEGIPTVAVSVAQGFLTELTPREDLQRPNGARARTTPEAKGLPGFVDDAPPTKVARRAPRVVSPPPEEAPTTPPQGPKAPSPTPQAPPRDRSSDPLVLARPHGATQRTSTLPPDSVGKNALVLGALLAVAIMMGVGIGVVVASYKRPPQIIIESSAPAAKERLGRVKAELQARAARGDALPPKALELLGAAGIAVSENDEARAEATLSELERLLGLRAGGL